VRVASPRCLPTGLMTSVVTSSEDGQQENGPSPTRAGRALTMWERLRPRKGQRAEVVALVDRGGVLVAGPQSAIDSVVAGLSGIQGARSLRTAADPLAAVASVAASFETRQDYVRFSPDSWELLRQHGAVPGEAGYFRMFVHDSTKKIAGQLQWEKVSLGAEQALSLQVSAVSLALRAAILDVQKAVERVEAKLDQVTKLLRAERRGDALGDHRTLTNLADRVRRSRHISAADWMSIAPMGPEIARNLEGLRAHVRSLLERDRPGRMAWKRAGEAEQLLEEEWLEETLALLAVVEHNFALWHELRIAHVAGQEVAPGGNHRRCPPADRSSTRCRPTGPRRLGRLRHRGGRSQTARWPRPRQRQPVGSGSGRA
jgi:hypothetical protein